MPKKAGKKTEDKKKIILIVEDEKILSDMYKDKFTKAGFKVYTAFDSEDGLKLTKKEMPDLIILDILLPSENGISFLRKKDREGEIKKIPVIVFSNYDDPYTKKAAHEFGVEDYLIKANYTPKAIVDKVKSYFDETSFNI